MDFEQLAVFHLKDGPHRSPDEGVCAMEAVAWLEGLPHSDKPACTCPVIGAFVRSLNDYLNTETRQLLVPYLPRLVGTVSQAHERERGEYLGWQAVTVIAPNALVRAGLVEHAAMLRAIPYHDWAAAEAAAAAAGYAAGGAAGEAARAAAAAAGYAAAGAARAAAEAAV
jgi:hypothetical protein